MQKLIDNINLEDINLQVIKQNAKYLTRILDKLKEKKIKFTDAIELIKDTKIMNILKTSLLYQNKTAKKVIDTQIKNIYVIKQDQYELYYFDLGNYKKDISLINKLFKITILLGSLVGNKNKVVIMWLPIDKKRKYIIDSTKTLEQNIKNAEDNFLAFTASGVSWVEGVNHYSLVSRYEEVEKLLIHELIHNYNIDGSKDDMSYLLKKYEEIKPKGNYHYPYSMFETFAELISVYLYIVFETYFRPDIKIKEMIIIQLLHSYNIVANLIKINGKTYEEFLQDKSFKGDICIYEYYFLKALAYEIDISKYDIFKDQKKIYEKIIYLEPNKLLEKIFEISYPTQHFNYSVEIKR